MRIRNLTALLAGTVLCGSALATAAQATPVPAGHRTTTYGQHLVNQTLATYPEVVGLAIHAMPLHGTDYVIVASNIGRIGKKADAADLRVIKTGHPQLAINTAVNRVEVKETLKDVSGLTIGAIGLVFHAAKGGKTAHDQQVAAQIQTFFAKHVLSEKNLADPYPYSAAYSPNNAAQALVDATLARHPELLILGMHVTVPNGGGNVFLGSNIGRIGKLADEDDMRVVNTGKSNFEISEDGRRYEVELVLEDAAGKNIGALGTVFRYRSASDKPALNALAKKIRNEIAREIPTAGSLLAKAR